MALSELAKLQIIRTVLFLLCVFDVAASTLLFIRVADGNAKDNIHAQVSFLLALYNLCKRKKKLHLSHT